MNRIRAGMIDDILTFPFRGVGKYMLVIGAMLSLVLSLGASVPFLGMYALMVSARLIGLFYRDNGKIFNV